MNYKIYHNPRCAKSREGLDFLQEHVTSPQDIEIQLYLKEPILSVTLLQEIVSSLHKDQSILDMVRTTEKIWKDNDKALYKENKLTTLAILEAIVAHPKLLQRPIVLTPTQSLVARPKEKILEIL